LRFTFKLTKTGICWYNIFMKPNLITKLVLALFMALLLPALCVAEGQEIDPKAKAAFANPNLHNANELYELARVAYGSGKLAEARLYALRMFFNGTRNQNLLNLLGVMEIQEGNNLLAGEWLRRANSLKLNNRVGLNYLARLPGKSLPIPVDASKLSDHFSNIVDTLPNFMKNITSPRLHEEAVYKALERGQLYFALALAEEYEKNYKDNPNGPGLTALCAWYLGRHRDALNIVNQNIKQAPFNALLLFVKAMIEDSHPATSIASYFLALYHLDQWDKILELADRYSTQFPNSAQGYLAKTRVLLDTKRNNEAALALQEAGKREPGNPDIELLWLQYRLQREEPDKAAKHVTRASRRGYNKPIVSLITSLFTTMQTGSVAELNLVANEITNYRPFSDQDAYSSYVSMLMVINRTEEAREVLDEWRSRFPENSQYAYLEAYHALNAGAIKQGLFWLRRAFQRNPNRLDMLEFLAQFEELEQDETLLTQIRQHLAQARDRAAAAMAISLNESEALPQGEVTSTVATAAPTAKGKVLAADERFVISAGEGVDQGVFTAINTELVRVYGIMSAELGEVGKPIAVNVVSAEGQGPLIAAPDASGDGVLVTTNFYDPEMVQNIIMANFDKLSDAELYPLIEEYPGNILATELARKMISHMVPEFDGRKGENAWMQSGLADILAANTSSPLVLRYRLLVAYQSIGNKTSALTSTNSLNAIFSDSYASPAVYETAKAQAYLMTAFLIKKNGYEKGVQDMMELIRQTSKGTDFGDAVKSLFGVSKEDFESSWKEAAYWALLQGTPYEWE
jgi:hypothetical protein